jgi:hypothetical protein
LHILYVAAKFLCLFRTASSQGVLLKPFTNSRIIGNFKIFDSLINSI